MNYFVWAVWAVIAVRKKSEFEHLLRMVFSTFGCQNFFLNIFFALKKLEKTPSKVAQKNSNPLFFLTASSAQTAQTKEFMFQNVAY